MPTPPAYSQTQALWSITRASFKAIFANPSAIIFSILFPIIFTLIFGAFGNDSGANYRVALAPGSDTTNEFYQGLIRTPVIRIAAYADSQSVNRDLIKGKLTAVLHLEKTTDSSGEDHVTVRIHSTTASGNTLGSFLPVLDYLRLRIESSYQEEPLSRVTVEEPVVQEVRKYRAIDFILPGQLGFSILFSTLFGVAFTFFGLREQLVLKRFYATPVRRIHILLGIGASRLFFQLLSVVVLIGFGHFFLSFTLAHGLATFLEMVLMTIFMLFLLLGVGLIFSSVAKTDSSIPLLINLFGFPQMLLSGTFFPVEVFPKWLQQICNLLPLTQFNEAVRKISFEGQHVWDCGRQLGILAVWILIIYAIAVRVLKWE